MRHEGRLVGLPFERQRSLKPPRNDRTVLPASTRQEGPACWFPSQQQCHACTTSHCAVYHLTMQLGGVVSRSALLSYARGLWSYPTSQGVLALWQTGTAHGTRSPARCHVRESRAPTRRRSATTVPRWETAPVPPVAGKHSPQSCSQQKKTEPPHTIATPCAHQGRGRRHEPVGA